MTSNQAEGEGGLRMQVIHPFTEGAGVWRGDSPGSIRKMYKCVGLDRSNQFCCGITLYAPGEGSSFHNHPRSEELDYVVGGSGLAQGLDGAVVARFRQGDLLLVPPGEMHRIYNDGDGPLTVLFVCDARTSLPEG